jgi:phosphopantothenoylcysteine decarboxylase / phosphopantothenate---cysteine ligase
MSVIENGRPNVLIMLSGSIAAYKVCHVISQLRQKNINVKVIMSEAVQNFIGASTIEALSGEKPITGMYQAGSVMDHIKLARWADLVLLAPATANSINKIAGGIGDDLISTLFLAYDLKKPFLITPAMNTKMYFHPATQKSMESLKAMGCRILETASGVLACGEVGYGKLLEPELIIQEILNEIKALEVVGQLNFLEPKNAGLHTAVSSKLNEINPISYQEPIRVLITGGGTSEPIDDVRSITNKSTGKTAATLADFLIDNGFKVTALFGASAIKPILKCDIKTFVSCSDLDSLMQSELKLNYDFVIHAAAVSDFSVKNTARGKISSDAEELTIELVKNKKIINSIKRIAPKTKLIGFKLTSTTNESEIEEKIKNLFSAADCDFVIQNDWNQIVTHRHVFNLHSKDSAMKNLTVDDLSIEIMTLMQRKKL